LGSKVRERGEHPQWDKELAGKTGQSPPLPCFNLFLKGVSIPQLSLGLPFDEFLPSAVPQPRGAFPIFFCLE